MDFAFDADSGPERRSEQQPEQHLLKRKHRRMDSPGIKKILPPRA
jgi:hypothetical protein